MPLKAELKLQIDPRHVAELCAYPIFEQASECASRKLYGVYYDTHELVLWRAGVTLRLQRSGRRWLQTVKCGGSIATGLHEHTEFETAIAGPAPDFDTLDASEVAAHFSSPELRAQLRPLFVTEFTRRSCVVTPAESADIEVRIDRGLIRSGGNTHSICEIGFEMKQGPAWRTYQLALQLLETAPLQVENQSKAGRGIALYLNTPRQPVKTPPSAVAVGMSGNDAFKALVQACIAHYVANQRGMLEDDDPEYLHQMRVALRRLRSVFSTFAPLFPPAVLAPPVAETRWLARILGPARDWDVFVSETLPPVMGHYAQHAGFAALACATARRRSSARRRARQAVVSTRGQGLLLALGAWTNAQTWLEALDEAQLGRLRQPAIDYAQETLGTLLKRVHKRGRSFARLTPADLHRLRIAAKKLRYATEFFAPLFGEKSAGAYRAALARLQDTLGAYNDAAKMTLLANQASRGLTGASIDEARGILLGWSAGTQNASARYLKRAWKEFRGAEPFWK